MLTPEEFATRWPGVRSRPPPDDPLLVRLPLDARRFIVECGLPSLEGLCLTFDLEDGLAVLTAGGREYVRIGSDGGTDIGVVPESGEVWSTTREVQRFMNSSVPHLAECMLLVRMAESVPSETEEQGRERLGALIEALRTADPRALAAPSGWWSDVAAGWAAEMPSP